tara:strand:- start:541 stop:2238 length:1698 start_codon:yes stop_codon:yes gene_type:complete
MDKIGYWAMEVWGGATFDACLRFLKEDPWARLDELRKALPNTRLSMLLRGQNLLGYRHYADDVVRAFVRQTLNHGIDIIRVFDALNDIRNMRVAIDEIKKHKGHAQGAVSYTISPVHTIDSFVSLGKEFKELGCDSIAIKDMAGLLTPQKTVELYEALAQETKLPVHIHSHSTSGLADICLYEGVMAGCRHIDTAISSFSGGASHPATESMVSALADTPYASGLDLNALMEVNLYFKEVRKKYSQFEGEAQRIDPRVQLYQVPGGMISNLHNQLKEQDALDKLDAVHEEIPKVRKDLGYPPLVTPTSQIVGTQAVLNVLTGERYQSITNEVKLYCQGKYGAPPGKINTTLQKKAIGQTPIIEERPADLMPNELSKLAKDIKPLTTDEEDVLSYAMFTDIAKAFFNDRNQGALKPEPLMQVDSSNNHQKSNEFEIAVHGESYHIKMGGYGVKKNNRQSLFVWIDGVPEEVVIYNQDIDASDGEITQQKKRNVTEPGDISVSMPGTVVSIAVKKGEKIKKGQVVLVLEAMKMETEVESSITGTVDEIYCKKGDKVTPNQVLVSIIPT